MKSFSIKPALRIKGEIALSGDKSIAHRCIIASALAQGKTKIENFPVNKDCLATLTAFKKLGIKISRQKSGAITVSGKGLWGLKKPKGPICVGDSGTTLRLILGVLAGQAFGVTLTAGESLLKRPMLRVIKPLRMMGANIVARRPSLDFARDGSRDGEPVEPSPVARSEEYPPITIKGGNLRPITYKMPVASAQVKSAILLAGLYIKGETRVIEPIGTRDHTERILKLFRARLKVRGNTIVIKRGKELVAPRRIYIPGDISSASFFVVAACILPDSRILIKDICLNPSRTGMLKVLKRMGAGVQLSALSCKLSAGEPMGNILVKSSSLKGTIVRKKEIPFLVDELPILMVAACFAQGETVFEGVGELRVKETDRIQSMSANLRKMGAEITLCKRGPREDIVIAGIKHLQGAMVRSYGDHRTAMSMVIAGLVASGKTNIDDISCISKSFPQFLNLLKAVIN